MVTAATPTGANPFAGLLPHLAVTLKQLRDAPTNTTNEERQLFSLIQYTLVRFGAPLLDASSADDLDDRLDELLETPDALLCTGLLARPLARVSAPEHISSDEFADAVSEQFGKGPAQHLVDSKEILDAWLDAQRQLAAILIEVPPNEPEELLAFSLSSPTIPAEVAEIVSFSLRASFCIMALGHAFLTDKPIASWLTQALVDRIVEGARQHVRLLASIPGINIEERIVPRELRLDLPAIEAKQRRARVTAQRSLDAARSRHGS